MWGLPGKFRAGALMIWLIVVTYVFVADLTFAICKSAGSW